VCYLTRTTHVLPTWRCTEGRLSKLEAAELLGVNERTLRRWCRRYEEEGADRRLGKPSLKRGPAAETEAIERLYRERYLSFTAKHFHEHAVSKHGFRWWYTWTKTYLHSRGCLKKAPRRGAHRRKRPRKAAARHDVAPGRLAALLASEFRSCTRSVYHAR